ncbi:MAG: hydrogenase expression/formation protein HypE [Proteobacteria bacterium]|nr:hydrogenase expression/formation protein HypE [Pseudomonadota bacterium]MBU1717046.1 hydrogenase expression/formation protein HypE [Pseudomonadota bacterium]
MSCPVPIMNHDTVQLAHGSGGKLSAELIDKMFLPRFDNEVLARMEDQAVLDWPGGRLAFTTDTFVVDPVFFPGGNIGDLAINGTVNDICMSGARPLFLSVAFIIEEGLPMETLHRILLSMEAAVREAGVKVVAGDTKVVPKGGCDKIFINTSGIGLVPAGIAMSAAALRPGDKVILSGTVADHGMAVMTSRESLSFQSDIKSDTASLHGLVEKMLRASPSIRAMRDPTRGGVAAILNEFAKSSATGIRISRDLVPVRSPVQAACELLGIDPLTVANEGKLVAVVEAGAAEVVLAAMREHPLGAEAVLIGEVVSDHPGMVTEETAFGGTLILDMPVGEQLPRIC